MESIIMPEPGGRKQGSDPLPLISCICITRGNPLMLTRIIECFDAQTYPHKELVIVCEDNVLQYKTFISIEGLSKDNVQLIVVKMLPKLSLGELRNIGIGSARGEFVCQWDDDDWYHINRLTDQYSELSRSRLDGCIMTHWLVFDATSKRAYISNARLWEGSILCRKAVLQEKAYEDKHIGEDTATIEYLAAVGCLSFLKDRPLLYIYTYHGNNTWNQEHWDFIFKCSTALSHTASMHIADIIHGKHSVPSGSLLLDEIFRHQYADGGMSIHLAGRY
jgi:glycosyltransferase involved in cell wall biosynthesis